MMRKPANSGWRAVLVLGAVAAMVSACAPSKEVALDAGDNGSQITLREGQLLVVQLEGNPSTGYTWEPAEFEEGTLSQVGEVQFKSESDLPGAGGMLTLRFKAVQAGQTTLNLAYLRPWEEGVDPLETFSVEVIVK